MGVCRLLFQYNTSISEDNENYELIGTVTDENTFAYSFSEIFEKKYIKVIETTYYGETYESVPFIILRNDDSYDVNFLDSDDDMLPDIYELKIGTDLNNVDTDNDGLTDFQECIYAQTDPLIYDSVIEGISDSDIDSDEDGLNNIDEISRGTYPLTADTDEDGLSDYDEINVYNTDPLNPDSDGDGLNDGSDVKLGLDPNNDSTMGIPDDEYVVPQSINADNKIISSINTSDSPYELSVEINTNRDAEKELTIIRSGYSKVIENDAMLGSSVDISISDTCNPERIVVKYAIKEPYLANTDGSFAELHEFQGIRRLNIFKFNTETNMLLPIDTQFDENNNMLYAEVNELGTYCIMDMEIWLKNLGVEYKSYKDEPSYSLLNARNVKFMSAEPPTPEKKSFNGSQYAVYDMTGMTWEEANAYCNELGGHLVTITTYDEQRFINNNLLKNCKNNLYWIGARAVNDSWQWVTGERFSYTNWKIDEPTDTQNENYIHMYGKSPETYISIGQWNNTYNYCDASANHFYATSNCGFICEWDDKLSPNTKYEILLPTKWKTIYLDGEISPNNGIDTDKDTLTDWEEVNTDFLIWNDDGSFELPTFSISSLMINCARFDTYFVNFLIKDISPRMYLPILSDPANPDTDEDSAIDSRDKSPLFSSENIYDRNAAYNYSQKYYDDYNDDYPAMDSDCANFVSQCLYAGGVEMDDIWYIKEQHFWNRLLNHPFKDRTQDWSFDWSSSWSMADNQCNYIIDKYAINTYKIEREDSIADFVKKHPNIQVGDLLYFHYTEDEGDNVRHATIISKIDDFEIYYAGHTSSTNKSELSSKIMTFDEDNNNYKYDYVYIIQVSDAL